MIVHALTVDLSRRQLSVEELLIGDSCEGTAHKRIMRADDSQLHWHELKPTLDQLQKYCEEYNLTKLYETIRYSPSAFEPVSEMADLMYHNGSMRPNVVSLRDNR